MSKIILFTEQIFHYATGKLVILAVVLVLILSHMTSSGSAHHGSNSNLISAFSLPLVLEKNPASTSAPLQAGHVLSGVSFNPWKTVIYFPAAAAKSLQSCPTLCDPRDGSHQVPPSLGFSRQEHWRGLPFPSPMHESEKRK